MFPVQAMLTHFNPFQCSISGKSGLVLTNGVRGGPLWGLDFYVKMQVINLYLCLECCPSGGIFCAHFEGGNWLPRFSV